MLQAPAAGRRAGEPRGPAWPSLLSPACAPPPRAARPRAPVFRWRADVYMVGGAGGNVTVHTLALKACSSSMPVPDVERDAVAAIRGISDKPIRYLANTSADADHVGGNAAVEGDRPDDPDAGEQRGGGLHHRARGSPQSHERADRPAVAVAGGRMADDDIPLGAGPGVQWPGHPARAFARGAYRWRYGRLLPSIGRRCDRRYLRPHAVSGHRPREGGSIDGEIDAINWLLDLLVPGEKEEGGTMVVPGHGRVCDESEVMEYRDMLTIVRDRVETMVEKGMTLEQVKAARPTFEYDPEYGASDAFVEAVVRGCAGAPVSTASGRAALRHCRRSSPSR